jgi:hypothetical protein
MLFGQSQVEAVGVAELDLAIGDGDVGGAGLSRQGSRRELGGRCHWRPLKRLTSLLAQSMGRSRLTPRPAQLGGMPNADTEVGGLFWYD